MITLHNKLLKKVDVCGQKSANAIQNAHFAGMEMVLILTTFL